MTKQNYIVRNAETRDVHAIIEMCRAVYPGSPAWGADQLRMHQTVFREGQFVVENKADGAIVGFAASLIVCWDDYEWETPWRNFTDSGHFTNHNPAGGKTLYGAEIMVHPQYQGKGVGSIIYKAREELTRGLGLLRIRAGARLRGYHKYANEMSAEEYTRAVIDGEIHDATLSFQLKRGFHILRVISNYLKFDPESLGYAAVIEWVNPSVALEKDYAHARDGGFHDALSAPASTHSDRAQTLPLI
jgi:GNAT superfamily N-acetyltransferase